MYYYRINEFAIESEMQLPCDEGKLPGYVVPLEDVITLRRASLADIPCILRQVYRRLCYDVGDGVLIEPRRDLDGGIAMHIDHKGRTITVDTNADNLNAASIWVIHAGLSAATLFRGDLTLHGSGLEIDRKFFSIMAESGTGKSTLSYYLLQNGARFGCDDVVSVRKKGCEIIAYPSISLFPKLHRDAAERSGLDLANLRRAIDTGIPQEEYWIPLVAAQRVIEPTPLAAMFVLQPTPEDTVDFVQSEIIVDKLTVAESAGVLMENLQGVWVVGKVLKQERLQAWTRMLAEMVPLYVLRYTRRIEALPLLAEAIKKTLAEGTVSMPAGQGAGAP